MIKHFLLFAGLLLSVQVMSQTGIGTTTPHASAKLEVNATDKGFLPPRVTLISTTDVSTISSPAIGLLVYNTGNNTGLAAGFYFLEWKFVGNHCNCWWEWQRGSRIWVGNVII